jgi:RNA polymerase primary sigma factor
MILNQKELEMSTVQETLKNLIEIGEAKGFVTFQQVFNAVTKEKSDPERLDKLLTLLEEHGIEIIDNEEDD